MIFFKKMIWIGASTWIVSSPLFGFVSYGIIESKSTKDEGNAELIVRTIQQGSAISIKQINFADVRFRTIHWLRCDGETIDKEKALEIVKNCSALEKIELNDCYLGDLARQCLENAKYIQILIHHPSEEESEDEHVSEHCDNP